ncbi:helix-turn-helix domain-containing protein [[Ruminococcus] torques]|uniref:helix-turn-helix domain-containing protein n=1 Tax=[Ruminococcus] torques TaxID=33039 RepID=UPI0039F49177
MGHTAIIKLIDNILEKEGDFISRLKDLRKERGYTQIKMQHLTGIDQSDYSKIENGKRYYTFEQCRKIALALDTSMDYLAELTDEKKPYPRS